GGSVGLWRHGAVGRGLGRIAPQQARRRSRRAIRLLSGRSGAGRRCRPVSRRRDPRARHPLSCVIPLRYGACTHRDREGSGHPEGGRSRGRCADPRDCPQQERLLPSRWGRGWRRGVCRCGFGRAADGRVPAPAGAPSPLSPTSVFGGLFECGRVVGVTPEVQERLERYRPRKDRAQGWEQLRPLVLELAELSNPPSAKNASATLSAITAYVLWAKGKGIPLEVANLANYQVIDWFLAEQHYIESTEETYRSALYRMVDAPRPSDPKGRRRPPLRPYTADEQAQMVALVDKQPTERSSLRLAALLHAGLGAGLNAVELRHLRPEDVSRRDGAVVVRAGSGDDRRDVPVLASHAEPLWNVACRARQLDWPYL